MEVGGMQAVVGSAQGQQLAITSAADLAGRGGAGGTIVIQVQGTPDFEARVIQNSVKGAQVQVAQDSRYRGFIYDVSSLRSSVMECVGTTTL